MLAQAGGGLGLIVCVRSMHVQPSLCLLANCLGNALTATVQHPGPGAFGILEPGFGFLTSHHLAYHSRFAGLLLQP